MHPQWHNVHAAGTWLLVTKGADIAGQVVTVSNAAHVHSSLTLLLRMRPSAQVCKMPCFNCRIITAGLNVMLFSHCRYHRMERSSQFVRRTVRMPETANLDQIKAKYDNGVLQLNIPKKEERPWQRINIQ